MRIATEPRKMKTFVFSESTIAFLRSHEGVSARINFIVDRMSEGHAPATAHVHTEEYKEPYSVRMTENNVVKLRQFFRKRSISATVEREIQKIAGYWEFVNDYRQKKLLNRYA